MGAAKTQTSTIIGFIAIILGVLVLIGGLGLGDIANFLGIVLIIAGILILVNVLAGTTLTGALFLVLGIVLVLGFLRIWGPIAEILEIVIGIVLIIYGILLVK